MEPKAKNYDEAAVECVKELTQEDIECFRMHIDYYEHHFEYGLYLRNRYFYLVEDNFLGDFIRDGMGEAIYFKMLPLIFPEFKGYEKLIRRITVSPFDDLNANYNLKYGKNFLVDIKPEKYFLIPEDAPQGEKEFKIWCEKHRQEDKEYSLAIAERIWEYDKFRKTAIQLGYSENEIEDTHKLCVGLIEEKEVFVPLEILFAKKEAPGSINAMTAYPKMIEWLFSKDESIIKLLPQYIFENREAVKIMVSANGYLLKLTPRFTADREIVMAALRASTRAADFIDGSLSGDRSIAIEAARCSTNYLMFSFDFFKQFNDDDEIVMLALEANGANICYASERIRGDYDMAVFALTHQRMGYPAVAYKSLSPELRSRKDLAMLELQAPDPSLKGFTDQLLDDEDIALKLIDDKHFHPVYYMSDRIKRKYLDRLPDYMQKNIRRELKIEE